MDGLIMRIIVVDILFVNGVIIDKFLEYVFYKVIFVGDVEFFWVVFVVCVWFLFFSFLIFIVCLVGWGVIFWFVFLKFRVCCFFCKIMCWSRLVGVMGRLVVLFLLDLVDLGVILFNCNVLGFNVMLGL